MALTLMKGSEAIAEAAIRAGARFFFGYPITPQTEIPEYMSARMPEIGGCFLQAESEVAAINMIYGAAGAGARALTSSSSPGVSLKQEGISYCAGAQLPAVILNVMRGGPGLGNIQASQGDYFQAVKGGGNGDYPLLTYAPASVQEAIDIVMYAFDKAEKYRIPVLFLADGIIAQMMEPVEMPEMVDYKIDPEKKPWACTGWKPGDDPAKRGVINSIYIDTETLSVHNDELQACYREITANEQQWEEYNLEGAEYVITAFGTVARIAKSAIAELKEQGINVEIGNWRGVYGAPGISKAQRDELVAQIEKATKSKAWAEALQKNDWTPAWLGGDAFGKFVDDEFASLRATMAKSGMI